MARSCVSMLKGDFPTSFCQQSLHNDSILLREQIDCAQSSNKQERLSSLGIDKIDANFKSIRKWIYFSREYLLVEEREQFRLRYEYFYRQLALKYFCQNPEYFDDFIINYA